MNHIQTSAAFASLVAIMAVQPAHAAPLYVAGHVGQTTNVGVSGINLSDGPAYGGAIGTAVGPVRVEAGVDRLSANFAGVLQAHALVYSASAFLDLPVGARASVFGGGGVDSISASADSPYGSGLSASGYGYHFGGGAAYRLNDSVIIEAQWRRLKSSNLSIYGSNVDLTADTVTVGARLSLA